MGKPSAPAPADPKVTAGAQTAQNIGTAIAQSNLNNVNQVTPHGSLTYEQTGSHQYTDPNTGDVHNIPRYTATQTLSPQGQAIHDQNQISSLNLATLGANQSGRLDGLLSRPMDVSGLPDRGDPSAIQSPNLAQVGSGPQLQATVGDAGPITRTYGTDFSEDRQKVEDALMSRLNPSLSQDREALEARLASQGISMGSEAYESAMDDFGRQSNDARMTAILGAGQEQSRLAGLEAQRAGFENAAQGQAFQQGMAQAAFGNDTQQAMHQNEVQAIGMNNNSALQSFNADMAKASAQTDARNAALSEQFAVRNQPLNELSAMMSGAQVQNPSFVNTNPAQIANTDFAGIQAGYDQAQQQRYQSQMSAWNNIWGGLGGLGGAAIGAF